jgi:hypothetical protein
MRKENRLLTALLALGLLWLTATAAHGQLVQVGLRGGLEMTQVEFSSDALRQSNRAGFYVGPQLKFRLPVVGLGIDGSVLYSRRDLKVEGETFRQESILLPVHARYSVGIGEVLSIFLCAGPQFSFNVGDDIMFWKDSENNNNQFNLQTTQLSLNFGGGITFAKNLEGALYYNIPIGKTADFTWDQLGSDLKDLEWQRAKSRTNAWSLSLTYFF